MLKALVRKLEIRWGHQLPVVHQTESSECGLACLAMICAHHGKSIDLVSLRQQFNLSARGATLAGIKGMAEQLGMASRALSLDMPEVPSLRLPCILHWNFNHFVVLVGASGNGFIVHDPAQGRRVVTQAEISKCFTGVALELWPGSSFVKCEERSRLSLRTLIGSVHGITPTLAKIFMLAAVVEVINLTLPVGTQLVMDHVIPAGDRGLLMLICIGLGFFILLRMAVSAIRAWMSLVMATLIDMQWHAGLFNHLVRLPLSFFERRKLGDIQTRFRSLDTLRETFTSSIVGATMDTIMVSGLLAMLVLYGGWLAWVVIGFTAIYTGVRFASYSHYRQLSEESLIRSARAGSYFMETLYGIAAIKVQGMSDRRAGHWLNLKIDAINSSIRVAKLDLLFGGINSTIIACDQLAILWLGAGLVMENKMTIGMFVAFSAFRAQFSERAHSLTDFLLKLRMTTLHNERISDIALNDKERRKPDMTLSAPMRSVSLRTDGLAYRYDSQSPAVFSGINIDIKAGENVAIAGPSGSGKTTLMKVLCGLFEPGSGTVMVNDQDIQQLGVNNYQKLVGCVMQDDRLFSGSIKENICGFADEMDEAWMMECARISDIHAVILRMPMGYETLIGELGEGLSGGQKQRLFIARALYRKPGIIFLDEATSALDVDSERSVNQAIRQLPITRVIIAHRASTLASADRVIRLQ